MLTQFNSHMLNTHLTNAYPPAVLGGPARTGFVDVLACHQTPQFSSWFAAVPARRAGPGWGASRAGRHAGERARGEQGAGWRAQAQRGTRWGRSPALAGRACTPHSMRRKAPLCALPSAVSQGWSGHAGDGKVLGSGLLRRL